MLRLTWVQPEDLLGHELRQAAQDGRDASGVERRWHEAGGLPPPDRAGASPPAQDPRLRALANTLLDELASTQSPLRALEPTSLPEIKQLTSRPVRPSLEDREREGFGAAPTEAPGTQSLHASWLGRAVGCLLGKPVEKLPLHGIRAIARSTSNWPLNTWFTHRGLPRDVAERHPWNRRSRPTSLAENIDGMPEDDDLNYPLLGLLLLRRHGTGFTTEDVARLWLDELPAGRTFTAERIAYRNLLEGIEPPDTAVHRNPFREWVGAQIRADVFGWTNPGDPARAAELAHADATLTHTANGVYGAMFVAAAIAHAAAPTATTTGTAVPTATTPHTATPPRTTPTIHPTPTIDAIPTAPTIHTALNAGLSVIPPGSRYAQAIRFGIETARAEPTGTPAGFASVVDTLHARYAHDHHWVHVLPNAALLAAALTHADGDFTGSICRAVSGGWDTDSNGATAGSITGLLAGSPDAIDDRWTTPLKNRLATSVADFDGIGFDELARLTQEART
ncbi:ADP-ribosylglycohydrolase family protein [Streptomyces sp. NBC_00056]|uniref:ADP-ribosylglycohydrolase family protein n=1 Tax=unclassified Streptomyces TaxID=2593676 RepID=UPI002E81DAAC|nr:ADP-ribosylglycohydrolase family protein [Streptomyces sp. NBC_00569]WUB96608.1 ADP-ribosylglycohydrolase family protein [Streptomyces sp. NBC_00569]